MHDQAHQQAVQVEPELLLQEAVAVVALLPLLAAARFLRRALARERALSSYCNFFNNKK